MATKTATKVQGTEGLKGATTEDGWKRASGGLPPMIILEVGDGLEGQIAQVDVIKQKEKRKNRSGYDEKVRVYYRIVLSQPAKGLDSKEHKPVSFKAGDMVTLPGSGALDNTFGTMAVELGGKTADPDAEADFQMLVGLFVRVKRGMNEKMKKGPWAGKEVKTYDVQWKNPSTN